jgi:undecaprenyl-diphosphatase
MVLEAVLFGIIQGVLEWIPVSSQGNVILVMISLFGYTTEQALNYSIFLHTGTLMAALVYFRKDVARLFRSLGKYRFGYRNEENRLTSFLIFSTILTAVVGFPIYLLLRTTTFAGEVFIGIIGISLIATGLLQKKAKDKGRRKAGNVDQKDTLLTGILQGLSVIPGISRSGITTSCLLIRKYDSQSALKLSFLMGIPAVLAAEIGLNLLGGIPELTTADMAVSVASAFVAGIISMHVIFGIAKRIKFWKFCVVLGIIALLPLLFYL